MPSLSNPGNVYDDLANTLVADTSLADDIAQEIESDDEFSIDSLSSGDMLLGQAAIADAVGGWTFTDNIQKLVVTQLCTGMDGASATQAIAGFPARTVILGVALHINTTTTGEADAAVALGVTADPNGYTVEFNLNAVATGFAAVVRGALLPWNWQADASAAGLAATFTATDLGDIVAGSISWHIFYITPTSP